MTRISCRTKRAEQGKAGKMGRDAALLERQSATKARRCVSLLLGLSCAPNVTLLYCILSFLPSTQDYYLVPSTSYTAVPLPLVLSVAGLQMVVCSSVGC